MNKFANLGLGRSKMTQGVDTLKTLSTEDGGAMSKFMMTVLSRTKDEGGLSGIMEENSGEGELKLDALDLTDSEQARFQLLMRHVA